jgi:glycine cleavage system H protein
MAEILADRKYTKDHEWALLVGKNVRVGISDYAQSELGDIVFVELPEAGTKVEAGKPFGTVEAVKTVAELFAPVSGTIKEINKQVQDTPSIAGTSCYKDGWLVLIELSNPAELNSLMDSEAYKKMIG